MKVSFLIGLVVLFVCISCASCSISEDSQSDASEYHGYQDRRDDHDRHGHVTIRQWLFQPAQFYPAINYALMILQLCIYHYYARLKWISFISVFMSLFAVYLTGVYKPHKVRPRDMNPVIKFYQDLVASKARYPLLVVWFHIFALKGFIGAFVQVILYGPNSVPYGPYISYWMAAVGFIYFMDEAMLLHAPTFLNVLSLFVMAIAYTSYTRPGNTKPSFGHVLYESISLFAGKNRCSGT